MTEAYIEHLDYLEQGFLINGYTFIHGYGGGPKGAKAILSDFMARIQKNHSELYLDDKTEPVTFKLFRVNNPNVIIRYGFVVVNRTKYKGADYEYLNQLNEDIWPMYFAELDGLDGIF